MTNPTGTSRAFGSEGEPEIRGPLDPIAAVTHADPYRFYARLVAERPLDRDPSSGLWLAASGATVTAVLTSERCRVRPAAEPVPAALVGSPAGEIFRHLVRMNDGERHCPLKQAVVDTLAGVDAGRVATESQRWAHRLATQLDLEGDTAGLQEFSFQLSSYVLGSLLGVPDDALAETAEAVGAFVAGIAPGASAEALERGKRGAARLLDRFGGYLSDDTTRPPDSLLAALAREARRAGREDRSVILANAIGFLSQAYEATAGLIGNTLVALANHPEVLERIRTDADLLPDAIAEVVRYDPPVQNTRRFVAADGLVAGESMRAGDAILVVLAAANRDPAANPDPDRFQLQRSVRRSFTFGTGPHACPGEGLATTIAHAGVRELLGIGFDPTRLARPIRYRPSVNTRIPLLGGSIGRLV